MFDYDNAREWAEDEINIYDVIREICKNNTAEELYNKIIKGTDLEDKFFSDMVEFEYDFKEVLSDTYFIREFLENEFEEAEDGLIDWIIDSPEYERRINELIELYTEEEIYEEDLESDWRNSR